MKPVMGVIKTSSLLKLKKLRMLHFISYGTAKIPIGSIEGGITRRLKNLILLRVGAANVLII